LVASSKEERMWGSGPPSMQSTKFETSLKKAVIENN
jgi:hypothetical protein